MAYNVLYKRVKVDKTMTYKGTKDEIETANKVVLVCRDVVVKLIIFGANDDAIKAAQKELFTATNKLAELCSTE